MEVILIKNVEGLGQENAVVKVKDGYARNYLFPRKLALPANEQNLRKLEQIKQMRQRQAEQAKIAAEKLRNKLSSLSLTIPVLVHEKDKLYGSVGPQEIRQALKEEGIDIEESAIIINEPIKTLGIYQVPLKLHPEVEGQLKIWVVKK
ncbi:MAG: 50S ribosomal protein L9 [Candidatus Omnitrophica bacterium]|nr:50S ribosomal protein L9 [Candidatus Omnitrophota bacterium]